MSLGTQLMEFNNIDEFFIEANHSQLDISVRKSSRKRLNNVRLQPIQDAILRNARADIVARSERISTKSVTARPEASKELYDNITKSLSIETPKRGRKKSSQNLSERFVQDGNKNLDKTVPSDHPKPVLVEDNHR